MLQAVALWNRERREGGVQQMEASHNQSCSVQCRACFHSPGLAASSTWLACSRQNQLPVCRRPIPMRSHRQGTHQARANKGERPHKAKQCGRPEAAPQPEGGGVGGAGRLQGT